MDKTKISRGAATREAIFQAAETIFAEHGFDDARIDAIAEASGYNKTLIFRYFGNKAGLYAEVLKRADLEYSALLPHLFLPWLQDDSTFLDTARFRELLKITLETFFDYMVDHPHLTRILNWEQADGWQTFTKIAAQFEPDEMPQLEEIFARAQKAGLLRPDLELVVMILLMQQLCWSSLNALPLYQLLFVSKGISANTTRDFIKQQIVEFLIAGIIHDPKVRV